MVHYYGGSCLGIFAPCNDSVYISTESSSRCVSSLLTNGLMVQVKLMILNYIFILLLFLLLFF